MDFEKAISLTGYGKFNVFVLIVCGTSLMSVIVETTCMSFVLPAAQCDFNLSQSDKSILTAISFLGVVTSSLLWGLIGDTMGRRKVMLITTYLSCALSVASSFAPHIWLFIICRFFNGFFVGGPSAVMYAYLSEFHSEKYRQKVVSAAGIFIGFATIYLPSAAWLILPMQWSVYIPGLNLIWKPWRLLVLSCSIPSFTVGTCLLFLPETPKFLWSVGKSEEALKILRNVYACNTGKPRSEYPVKNLVPSTEIIIEASDSSKSDTKLVILMKKMLGQFSALVRAPNIKNTAKLIAIQFGIFASSSGYIMWLPDILNKLSIYHLETSITKVTVCDALSYSKNGSDLENRNSQMDCNDVVNEDVFTISILLGVCFMLGYIFNTSVINIIGKKLLLVSLILITGVCGVIIDFVSSYWAIVSLSGMFLMGGTAVSVTNTIAVDLYSTQIRAMAVAITLMAGRCGAVVSSNAMGYFLDSYCHLTFYLFAGQHIVLVAIAMFIPIPLFPTRKPKPFVTTG